MRSVLACRAIILTKSGIKDILTGRINVANVKHILLSELALRELCKMMQILLACAGATLYMVMNDFVENKETLVTNLELLWKQVGAIVAGNQVAEMIGRVR